MKLRQAFSYAIDRHAFVKAVHQGGAEVGAAMQPKPFGVWGLMAKDLAALPGYGKAADDKARARKLLAEAGYSASNPLRIEMAARAIPQYLDFASFVISELKAVGVEATLKQIETAQWHPLATRKEYQAGPNLTGIGVDDPDANFFENFACASPRNYTGYCNEQLEKVMAQQSQELDAKKRVQLVAQIQRTLEDEAARPTVGWRMEYYTHWKLREEPDPPPVDLQLGPDAGSLAGQVTDGLGPRGVGLAGPPPRRNPPRAPTSPSASPSPCSPCSACRSSSSSSCASPPATSSTSSSPPAATSTTPTRSSSCGSWASTGPSGSSTWSG